MIKTIDRIDKSRILIINTSWTIEWLGIYDVLIEIFSLSFFGDDFKMELKLYKSSQS